MESDSEISNLKKDVQRLENAIKAQSEVILQLIERTGETFAKQAFTVDELMKRWGCGETFARKIIRTHKLKLLRGADGKPRKPYAVLRTSVLQYESGETMLPRRRLQSLFKRGLSVRFWKSPSSRHSLAREFTDLEMHNVNQFRKTLAHPKVRNLRLRRCR